MFDGNHRPRRDVNLGGRRRPRGTTLTGISAYNTAGVHDARSQVLEQSRLQREERRSLQMQQVSAGKIQKVARGWLTRKSLIQTCLEALLSHPDDATSRQSLLQLSMLLSLTVPFHTYAREALFILGTSIHELLSENLTIVSKQRILQRSLLELTMDNDGMLNLIRYLVEEDQNPVHINTFIVLIQICQHWMCKDHDHDVTEYLWKWSCKLCASNPSQIGLSYLAVTLFGYAGDKYQSVPAISFFAEDSYGWSYRVLLEALASFVDDTGQDKLMNMLEKKEANIMRRVINLYHTLENPNPLIVLPLLESLLRKQNQVAFLTCLKIRGDDIRAMILDGRQMEELKETFEDDDDDEEDDSSNVKSSAGVNYKRHRHGGANMATRLTRQQLQTVPRLNQLYQDELDRLGREAFAYFKSLDLPQRIYAVELADQLANASLWQQWGMCALSQESSSSRNVFVSLLGRLLRGCSGCKTLTTSPFLSQLAYSKPFLEALWFQTMNVGIDESEGGELSCLSMNVFCDVFSHHLISLSDKEFLQNYTRETSSPRILAENVVGRLKTVLYDLYWNKPVLSTDVRLTGELQCHRARLLLSATKAWNSLYERWSRLVYQSPFCDESAWWFPRLASRDDDGAVIGAHENSVITFDDDTMDMNDSDNDNGVNEREVENDSLADTFRDPKMARILTFIPQALPFERRVKLFNSLLNADKLKTQDESAEFRRAVARMMQREDNEFTDMAGGLERVEIHRDHIYADSMKQLNNLGRRLKSKIKVTMINKLGAHEAGIDGGGVFKEFLDDLIKEAFNPPPGSETPRLFVDTPLYTLAVNMDVIPDNDALSHYEFLGRVLGKSVYESILVEPQFCLPFLNQLLGKQNALEDLKNFDFEFYHNLMKLRTLSETEILEMGLVFELNVSANRTVPLIPNGSSVAVTKHNVYHYIHLVAHQRLNLEGAAQTKAFLRGFRDLIPAPWVRLFSAHELQKLISGDDSVRGIDVSNLKEAMQYAGGYHPSQPILIWFWELIENLSPKRQRQFLRFMTSCSRQPLLGFRALEPLPCIQQVRIPEGTHPNSIPLPTSSTCMNLLKLPNYSNKELLRTKMIAAIEAGAGFELT